MLRTQLRDVVVELIKVAPRYPPMKLDYSSVILFATNGNSSNVVIFQYIA